MAAVAAISVACVVLTIGALFAVVLAVAQSSNDTAFDKMLARLPECKQKSLHPEAAAEIPEIPKIPRVLYICNKTKEDVPAALVQKWRELNPGYDVQTFGNRECEEYLRSAYGERAAHVFSSIPDGPIKADLWRAHILYDRGGVYADVDMMPVLTIADAAPRGTTLAVSGSDVFRTTVNPCFIATVPRNPILGSVLELYDHVTRKKRYGYWQYSIVLLMTRALQPYVRDPPRLNNRARTVRPGGGHVIQLLRETVTRIMGFPAGCSKPRCTRNDFILNKKGQRVFKVRGDNYDRFTHQFKD